MSRDRWDTFDERSAARAGRATSRDRQHLKRQARQGDDLAASAYKMGVEDGRREARAKSRSTKPRKSNPVTRPVKQRVQRGASQGFGQALSVVQPNVAGGVRTLTLTFFVLMLYLMLTSADKVSGALGGVKRGFEWLGRPDTSIKFAR